MAPLVLNMARNGDEWSASRPHYRLKRRLEEHYSRSGRLVKETNLLPQTGIELRVLSLPSRSSVSIQTGLCRLSTYKSNN